jgi:hypothetical protein
MTIDPIRHRYAWKGRVVPGVTKILTRGGWRPDFSQMGRVAPSVLQAALARGSAVHEFTHAADRGQAKPELVTDTTVDFLAADAKLRANFDLEVIDGERGLVHPTLSYGGRYDVCGWYRGKRALIDRKTGASVHASVWLQLVAYKLLRQFWFPEEPIEVLAVAHLRPDAEPRLITHPCESFAVHCWMAALWRYRWIERFGV